MSSNDDNLLKLLDKLSDQELDRLIKMMNIQEISDRINKNSVDVAKIQAETAKIQAETTKIQQEMRYYPLMTAGGAAILVFILNLVAKKFGLL